MIYEIAEIDVVAGQSAEFEAAVAQASPQFAQAHGCHSFALQRSIEQPLRYRLVVGWASVEDHTVRFRQSDAFRIWRELAGPYFASPPRVEHVEVVLTAFEQ